MVENVREALDSENEWFFDAAAGLLYLRPNRTDASGRPAGKCVAVTLDTLVSINATMANPAHSISLVGLKFRDAADVNGRQGSNPHAQTASHLSPHASPAANVADLDEAVGGAIWWRLGTVSWWRSVHRGLRGLRGAPLHL